MRLLHLSDTHLRGGGSPGPFGVDAAAVLRGLLEDLRHLGRLDAVVVSGDLADDGSREAYAEVREILGEFAVRHDARLVLATGNHDERASFTAELGSGHLAPDGKDLAEAVLVSDGGERAAVGALGGLRLVTLDSLVPGKGYGRLGEAQLDWLREVLSTPAPRGTVLVLHHPPVALDVEVQRALGLRNAGALAEAIRGTDVGVILCGHFHLQISARLEQAAVWVTPGVVSRVDLTAPPHTERAVRGASATLVELDGPAAPLFHTLHARDPRAGEAVHTLDEPGLRDVIARFGE